MKVVPVPVAVVLKRRPSRPDWHQSAELLNHWNLVMWDITIRGDAAAAGAAAATRMLGTAHAVPAATDRRVGDVAPGLLMAELSAGRGSASAAARRQLEVGPRTGGRPFTLETSSPTENS
ncbi:hypothetical protein GCM10025872_26880 [Barrientosiimonas endolithica]|uniref:Uncharacterized protein n=1 Tax=Barrientosiimonas endolithica TaxID=1535208 RepID=A0ABM8HDG7_9MICO|nr:hypothetical protein GCM10025872_26880 [Barrientosiimonas endolithica]